MLHLGMIVRDEAHIIERCLASVKPHITSFTIIDTGSSDDTQELIHRSLPDTIGAVHERPWVNFGHNRSELCELSAGKEGFLLFLDADDEFMAPADVTLDESVLAYMVNVLDGGPIYKQPRIVNAKIPWRYEGVTHEYLTSDEMPVPNGPTPPGVAIFHRCDGSRRPRKFAEDLVALRVEHERNPDDPRTVFYLANTLRDLGLPDQALPLYWQRAQMGGWAAEAETAARQALKIEAGDYAAVGVPTP